LRCRCIVSEDGQEQGEAEHGQWCCQADADGAPPSQGDDRDGYNNQPQQGCCKSVYRAGCGSGYHTAGLNHGHLSKAIRPLLTAKADIFQAQVGAQYDGCKCQYQCQKNQKGK